MDAITLRVLDNQPVAWSSTEYVPMVPTPLPEYEGPYEFTPSATEQVASTSGLAMRSDIIIAPIPSNYGLITYNGSSIRVS